MTTTTFEHQPFCQPRPGEDAPRMERYSIARYGQDGTTRMGDVLCIRCAECGNATYDGVKRD